MNRRQWTSSTVQKIRPVVLILNMKVTFKSNDKGKKFQN